MNARIVRSAVALGPVPARAGEDLVRAAHAFAARPFILERTDGGRGPWAALPFGEALARARSVGAGLLAAGFSTDAPLAVLAENGIDYAIVALAALYVGVPFCPLSAGYARADGDPGRLRALLDVLRPRAAFVPDPRVAARLALSAPGLPIVGPVAELAGDPERADEAYARTNPDTVAKILFTSGSTGTPKGVITTHRMLCANQTMLEQAWADATRAPVLVDWMPWSHVASGSKVFGMILRRAGTLYIDGGRPMPGAFETTIRNLHEISPTMYFTVPRGYALLAHALAADEALAQKFFTNMRGLVNAGASLPADVRAQMATLGRRVTGREIPVLSPYGATETAPMATAVWGNPPPAEESIGLPVPGVEVKLAPVDDRYEIRVKGPSITPGYWRDPAATAAAFDEDGFYKTGDAGDLVDPADPSRGLAFRGRIAENFKLSSGTWVNAGSVRVALIEAGAGAIDDAVIAGHDRDDLAALVFFNLRHAREITGLPHAERSALRTEPALLAHFRSVLATHNATHSGSSTRIASVILLPDEPDRSAGELTDKGTVNQRVSLALRTAAVHALYHDASAPGHVAFAAVPSTSMR